MIEGRGIGRTLLALTALFGAAVPLTSAHGQATVNVPITIGSPPPVHSAVDANGVNLFTGALTLSTQDVAVGPAGAEALNYMRTFIGSGSVSTAGWTDNVTGTISGSGNVTVSIGSVSETFYTSGSVFLPQNGGGSSLVLNAGAGTYTYTSGAGVVYSFSTALSSTGVYPSYTVARITSITAPDGHKTTFTYQTASICAGACLYGSRLSSVNNNAGYQLKLSFVSDAPPVAVADFGGPWAIVKSVAGINNAVDYCAPTANSCSGFTATWPSMSYGSSVGPPISTTTTDTLGRVTTYKYDASYRITNIIRPAGDSATIVYNGAGQVQSVSNGVGTWNYAYAVSGNTPTTTVTDPLGHTRVAVGAVGPTYPNCPTCLGSTGQIASDTDGLNRTTSFVYDVNQRPTLITKPAGDKIQYVYDARANVTSVTRTPAPGSPLANIVLTASFDAACALPAKCNQPNATVDAVGAQTDYGYDSATGLPLIVVPPAPTAGGSRPQFRSSYTPLYAWYKNSVGTQTQAATPIYKRTGTSTCQTLAQCVGMADEAKGTLVYGTAGVANNLATTAVSVGSGDGVLTATTSQTYDSVGNILTTVSPLGAAQTLRTRYDAARQVVGVVGPDPDGAGPLNNPAQRITYDLDGRTTLLETGTVLSQSDPDWPGFVSLQQKAATFDAAGRTVKSTLAGAGATWNVGQFAYDNANNPTCSTVRMNPALFTALPVSACTPGANGAAPADMITVKTYDAADELATVTNGWGTGAQSTYATMTYSPNGLVKTIKDANANLTTNVYDGFDRVSQTQFPLPTKGANASNPADYEGYTYQADGNVIADRRRDGTSIAYSYDALGRMTLKHFPPSTQPDVYFGYDLLGRGLYARFTSATGPGVTNTWDALGRQLTTTAAGRSLSYQYDLAGNRTRVTWPDTGANALFVSYAYDNLNRMTQVQENGAASGTGLLAQYTYDAMGERSNIARAGGAGAGSQAHDDAAGRLQYLAHNLLVGGNVGWTFSYSPANQLTGSTATNDAYAFRPATTLKTYVANGLNQYPSVSGTAYAYDGRGNLTSDGARAFGYDLENHLLSASAPTATTMTYDPLGRLQSTTAGGGPTNFLYDGSNLVGEYDGTGAIVRRYAFGANVDEPVMWYEGAGTATRSWLHADRQSSVIAWSNAAGSLVNWRGYSPYGEPNTWAGSRFAYTGQAMVPEAQLYYYKSRFYDPGIGRFLQVDTVGYASDVNSYAYTHGDAVNGADSSGLDDGDPDIDPHFPAEGSIYYFGSGQMYHSDTFYGVGPTQTIGNTPTIWFEDPTLNTTGSDFSFGLPSDGGGFDSHLLSPYFGGGAAGAEFSTDLQKLGNAIKSAICRLPTLNGGGGFDAYAVVGGSVSGAVGFNPRNGQVSLGFDSGAGFGLGGGGRANLGAFGGIGKGTSENLPIASAGLNVNVTGMYFLGITASRQVLGSSPGDWSVSGTGGPDATANVNVSGHGAINLPRIYNLGC